VNRDKDGQARANDRVRLIVSLLVIAALFALGYRRADFFLVRGKLDAPIKPVPWLGFPKPDPWTHFGGQWAVYIGLGLLGFLVVAGRPSWSSFVRAAPLFPAVERLARLAQCIVWLEEESLGHL
jgi:hypothetical protein